MEHVIAALLNCIANFVNAAAELVLDAEGPAASSTDAQELLLLAQAAQPLYAALHSSRTEQLAALDTLEAQCFNKLSSYARDYMEEVYDTMRLLRNDEL